MKRLILAAVLSLAIATPIRAETCHDLVMSYIYHDQDPPTEPGDYLYTEKRGQFPKLVATTGYCEGTHGSHGDRMRQGYVAYTPESYGCAMEIYEAVPTESGYELGDYLGLYEIRDCGYGKSTGQGESKLRADKRYQGSLEAGLAVDRYAPTLAECKEWMKATQGMVFIQVIPAKG